MKRVRPLVLTTLALGVFACGPSFQAIYEGDARFEHCYALDDTPNVPMTRKSDCWSDWTQHYTFGQTRDRVEYATMRYRALSRLPSSPTDEAIMGAAPGEGRYSTITTPAPTNAFAPPPKTLGDGDAGPAMAPALLPPVTNPPVPGDVHPPLSPPKTTCVDRCGNGWQDCKSLCAGKRCDECDKAYSKCVKACF